MAIFFAAVGVVGDFEEAGADVRCAATAIGAADNTFPYSRMVGIVVVKDDGGAGKPADIGVAAGNAERQVERHVVDAADAVACTVGVGAVIGEIAIGIVDIGFAIGAGDRVWAGTIGAGGAAISDGADIAGGATFG